MKNTENSDKEAEVDEEGVEFIDDDEEEEDDDDEDAEEAEEKRIQEQQLKVAKEEAKEHDVDRLFERLGMKPFPECIVSREEWGAQAPKSEGLPLQHPVPNVVFTYTTGIDSCEEEEDCVKAVQELQRRHMVEGAMSDIGFNFLVGGDHRVYEGRGWHTQPDPDFQFPELKGKRLDVGFIGNFTPAIAAQEPPWGMAGMAIELAHCGVLKEYLLREYRLVESQEHLVPEKYEPDKEEYRPDLQLRLETYWPGQVIKEELPWENPEDQVPKEEYVYGNVDHIY